MLSDQGKIVSTPKDTKKLLDKIKMNQHHYCGMYALQ